MDIIVARMVHLLSVVLWIGGVGFVTTVLFPTVRRTRPPEARLAAFLQVEAAFAPQARVTVALAGLSGFYMTWRLGAWARFRDPVYWWMDAMVLLWLVFVTMLFLIEPLGLNRRLERAIADETSSSIFNSMERFHRIMLGLSLVTVLGAVGGSHGAFI